MAPRDFYHDGMRVLQDRFDGRRVADAIAKHRRRAEFWDEDRLTHSLSVLIERALGGAHGLPVLIRVDASESAVALELRTRSILPRSAGADLRFAVARAAIAAHGGWLEERRDGGGVTLVVSLPRSGDTKATAIMHLTNIAL